MNKYENSEAVGYQGWVEAGDKIAFIALDGHWVVFDREENGAVTGEPHIIR